MICLSRRQQGGELHPYGFNDVRLECGQGHAPLPREASALPECSSNPCPFTFRRAPYWRKLLQHADLSSATLQSSPPGRPPQKKPTNLTDADLSYAALTDADLTGADLSGADLTHAIVIEEQLDKAKSLKGATMPNGQKYEDWLKNREGGKE